MREPGDDERPMTEKDISNLERLMLVGMRAVLPADVFVTPELKLQEQGKAGPASLLLKTYRQGYMPSQSHAAFGKLIAASIIEVFPLRFYNGVFGSNTKRAEIEIRHNIGRAFRQHPKSFSAHEQIENRIMARQVFGDDSLLVSHLDGRTSDAKLVHETHR